MVEVEQTIQFGLDLGVRSLGAKRDEVDDQPCKAPVRHPAPKLTELSEDAVFPLSIRRFSRRVWPWNGGTHEGELLSMFRVFMPLRPLSLSGLRRHRTNRRIGRSPECSNT